ncbi:FmdB family zinc ribbon protein [Nocardia cerradoensis]|uniref:FmdB family zinc ribbon protein n=1 Tax=Nocardia cerradoensis TaxID=85688 RepID=UPI001FE10801|nr:zinc ribbon domain-containing protein [Nocardia cerradoensis]
MPTYAYRCRECTESFELTRPMSESGDPAVCPGGHRDTVKLLTTVALTGKAAGSGAPSAPPPVRRRLLRWRLLRLIAIRRGRRSARVPIRRPGTAGPARRAGAPPRSARRPR